MAEFLDTDEITHKISKIIDCAEDEIFIVSPYLKIAPTFYRKLEDAASRGIKITFVYGKQRLEKKVVEDIKALKNSKLYYLKDLHAKCYLNEDWAVLTSMNMYIYSQTNNEEMGVYCESSSYGSGMFDEIYDKVEWYIKRSQDQTKWSIEDILTKTEESYSRYKGKQKSSESSASSKPIGTQDIAPRSNGTKTIKKVSSSKRTSRTKSKK